MRDMGKRYIPLLFVIGWIALIFILSSETYKEQSIQPTLHRTITENTAKEVLPDVNFDYDDIDYSSKRNPFQLIEFVFRKSAHLFIYAVLAIAGAITIKLKENLIRRWLMPLLLVVVIASLDELNQRMTPGRTPNPQDVLVDLIGGCIGTLVYLASSYLYRRNKSSAPFIK
jgi:VanZ family protein